MMLRLRFFETWSIVLLWDSLVTCGGWLGKTPRGD